MRKHLELKAWILLTVFLTDIFISTNLFALGSGPSQPEMAAFTPAGTTEMVDPFTGDFTYNIPLMDVEGYPVNIAYNSGVTMEQEASWVGLGWNLNVGTVNRSVRGLPDDFKGDEIRTETNMKPFTITKAGVGTGIELFGLEKGHNDLPGPFSGNFGLTFMNNNYKGMGIAIDASLGASAGEPVGIGGNVGLTLNSLDGATINSSLSASISKSYAGKGSLSFGGSLGTGFNTRTGQTIMSMGTTAGYSNRLGKNTPANGNRKGTAASKNRTTEMGGSSATGSATFMPMGLESYTPYPTLKMQSTNTSFSATVGGEIWGLNVNGRLHGSQSVQELTEEGKDQNAKAYGYLYSEAASSEDLKDFNRDKQISPNPTTRNLSPVNATYDIFSVSGQGVGGMIRPFRNDIGHYHDPYYYYNSGTQTTSLGGEVGLGTYAKAGINFNTIDVKSESGPMKDGEHLRFKFKGDQVDNQYEKVYWKAAGELSETDLSHYEAIEEDRAIAMRFDGMSPITTDPMIFDEIGIEDKNLFPEKNENQRQARSKLFSTLTAEEAKYAALNKKIYSYSGNFYEGSIATDPIERMDADDPALVTANINHRKAHHISEITQVNPNGERYVFGIPAYNNIKEEVNYNTGTVTGNAAGKIQHLSDDASKDNDEGKDHYFSRTTTPAYAHSYLLTAKQSADYQDVTGDGITADDAGNAWKFNYERKSASYRWRSPYVDDTFMEGFKSNKLDQKASYSYGEKELWYLHTIESKNMVAEFHLLEREDALGCAGPAGGKSTGDPSQRSYKLDKIILFNKYDRLKNKGNATPIKTVRFEYDYSLCKGVSNNLTVSGDEGTGKLTLNKIFISYGNSAEGELSPYTFNYDAENVNSNPPYNAANMDRWGNYKDALKNPDRGSGSGQMYNGEYPYVLQDNKTEADLWAGAWNLKQITLPSGGTIDVSYEADDYAYVQDKTAMQMFPIEKAGTDENYNATTSGTTLYNTEYLFFKRPSYISKTATQDELRDMLLGPDRKIDNMYFRFLTKIIDNENEYAAGYISAFDVGFASDNTSEQEKIWLKVANENTHPISTTAWGYFRQNLFEILYRQPDINDGGLKSILKGMAANMTDIKQMFTGVEAYLKRNNVAAFFEPNESYIRLYHPSKTKLGGGARVKQIVINDNWQDMSGEGYNETYGQTYEYTTTDEKGNTISSGVATYEPLVGNDENPFREPIPFMASESQGHIPAIEAYQETPFGESFFPGASVGYSKVTVKNVHYQQGRTSNAVTEHEFHTAKDFPVIVKETELKKYHNPPKGPSMGFPFSNQIKRSEYAASQGYSIILNDMHGKPASTVNYALVEDANTNKISRRVNSGSIYKYHTKTTTDGKMLDNKVKILTKDGLVKEDLLGVEYELAIDSRRNYERNKTKSYKTNYDVIPSLFGAPFPLPTHFENTNIDIKESKTMVITKVIQTYGIVESVYNYTDQHGTTTYNHLYDGQTGRVLLTETQDEYNRNEFQYYNPAYLMSDLQRMGAASENIHFETHPVKQATQCNGEDVYDNPGFLKHGDEVLVLPDAASPHTAPFTAWVEENEEGCNLTATTSLNSTVKRRIALNYNNYNQGKGCSSALLDNTLLPLNIKGERGSILEDVTLYHLQETHADYINDLITNLNIGSNGNVFSTFDFCNDYSVIDSKTTVFGAFRDMFMEIPYVSGNNTLELETLFDFSDPISGKVENVDVDYLYDYYYTIINNTTFNHQQIYSTEHYPCQPTSQPAPPPFPNIPPVEGPSLVLTTNAWSKVRCKIDYQSSWDKYFNPNQLILAKYQIQLPNGGGTDVAYYIESVRDYIDPHGLCPEYEYTNCETITYPAGDVCTNAYRLLDRYGNAITDLTSADKIKVIRSGNKNLLMADAGAINSSNNPLKIESGSDKFLGINGSTEDNQILQATSVDYSDCYRLDDPYNGTYNRFLTASDGRFQVNNTYRYITSRNQAAGIQTATDGYLKEEPQLWANANNASNFEMQIDRTLAGGYQANGWNTEEQLLRFQNNGMATEAKNSLDIHSAVLTNTMGAVEAVASNTKERNIAFEGFEKYNHFNANRNWKGTLNTLATDYSIALANVAGVSYGTPGLNTNHENILVEGMAHSGKNSIFLLGEHTFTGDHTINYDENRENSLTQIELANLSSNPTGIKYFANQADFDTEKSTQFNDFIAEYWSATPADINTANTPASGQHTLDIEIDQTNNEIEYWPEEGEYFFSIWVKEPLRSGTPYAGLSPSVTISSGQSTVTFNPIGDAINGWYKIEGFFDRGDCTEQLTMTLDGGIWGAFFDDLRIHPKKSNMVVYIYDPISGRLQAQLDENNFATYYEYNEEGTPAQVKRETAKGILTISESRQSLQKQ